MLTREHAIARYDKGHVFPDRLTVREHRHYLPLAGRMLEIYDNGVGLNRQQLHRRVESLFADLDDALPRRIAAFCKLLDDVSEFEGQKGTAAANLRRRVFRTAAPMHPLVEQADRIFEYEVATARQRISEELQRPWDEIENSLFADVIELQRLRQFHGYEDARALLARYNVAQFQAALYDARRMTITATSDFKSILRYAKLAQLLHKIERTGRNGYRIVLDGPASILRRTRRYGVMMARTIPGLLSCSGWSLEAEVIPHFSRRPFRLTLSPADGLRARAAPIEEFDSTVEEKFAKKWGEESRDGWTLVREGSVLHSGQSVFVPDFELRHESGFSVLLEIIGFWTPEYLEKKAATLALFPNSSIILAIAESLSDRLPKTSLPTVTYKTVLKLEPVLEALERIRR